MASKEQCSSANLSLWGLGLLLLAAPVAFAQQSAEPAPQAQQNAAPTVFAQQEYVSRYDVYAGFADVESPAIGLNQTGYHIQVGLNPRPWYSMGFDYTNASGSMIITPNELPTAQQQVIDGEISALEAEGALPANYALRVNTDASLQSYAMGPQFNFRHFRRVTIFTHPSFGAFREQAWPHGTDPFALAVVSEMTHGTGTKIDWTGFYGFAGGMDITITRHFGLRAQADFVWQHPFNDVMANGFWTERYSFGPSYHFGRNILNARKSK
jgi:hypothetical protein